MINFEVKNISELSSIGDSFVNFIYSLAVSNALKRPVGVKVSNSILSEALIRSGLRGTLSSRMSKHEMADHAESLIFHAWLKERITIKECADILGSKLNESARKNRPKLREASVNAFADLLTVIARLGG